MKNTKSKRKSEVQEQIVNLESASQYLFDTIRKLEERCASVFNPSVASCACPEADVAIVCPLAGQLQIYVRRFEVASYDIDLLIEHMEL